MGVSQCRISHLNVKSIIQRIHTIKNSSLRRISRRKTINHKSQSSENNKEEGLFRSRLIYTITQMSMADINVALAHYGGLCGIWVLLKGEGQLGKSNIFYCG